MNLFQDSPPLPNPEPNLKQQRHQNKMKQVGKKYRNEGFL